MQQPEKLVKHINKLPTLISDEVMTIAEQLAEIMFKDKYENLARQREEQTVINVLKKDWILVL